MFDKELTVINKWFNPKTKQNEYKTSLIHGFWSFNDGISISGTNLVKNDGFKAIILMNEPGYVDPKEYVGDGWTLKNDDYIVKGTANKVISIIDVKKNYECLKIMNISVKDYGSKDMWHFEISGE